MGLQIALLVGSLVVLTVGAELLVRGAVALAVRLGVSALAVGLTVVAFGTSTPELVVTLRAASVGSAAIAVGNVVGSNICNIALILGLGALIRPPSVHAKVFRIDAPVLVVASVVVAVLLSGIGISRVAGVVLLAALALFTAVALRHARNESSDVKGEFDDAIGDAIGTRSVWLGWSILQVSAGLALLMAGGSILVAAAVTIATTLGVSEAVIGLTIVAVGTSLPELAATVVAAVRGQGDIAVGNVVGSNIFNLLGIVGAGAVVAPIGAGALPVADLWFMVALAVVLIPIARTGFTVSRIEGALLLTVYGGYIAWLIGTAGASPIV